MNTHFIGRYRFGLIYFSLDFASLTPLAKIFKGLAYAIQFIVFLPAAIHLMGVEVSFIDTDSLYLKSFFASLALALISIALFSLFTEFQRVQ